MLKAKQFSTGSLDDPPPEAPDNSSGTHPPTNYSAINHTADETARCGEQLDRILSSATFRRSKKLKELLRYIITIYLHGKAESLKEYTIGVDVFKRKPSFNPASDPIVRVETSRLRQQLEKYYQGEGLLDPLRIDIPRGTYIPIISLQRGDSHRKPSVDSECPAAVLVLPFVLFDETRPFATTDTLILTDPLLHGLARRTSLRVVPRIWGIKPVYASNVGDLTGKQGVKFVVEGSIVMYSGQWKVFVHVSDMHQGKTLWSEQYDVDKAQLQETAETILQDLVGELRSFAVPIGDAPRS